MSLHIPPTATNLPEWVRKASVAINTLLGRRAFPALPAAPADPQPGDGYYDTTTNKARIWDGGTWNDLW